MSEGDFVMINHSTIGKAKGKLIRSWTGLFDRQVYVTAYLPSRNKNLTFKNPTLDLFQNEKFYNNFKDTTSHVFLSVQLDSENGNTAAATVATLLHLPPQNSARKRRESQNQLEFNGEQIRLQKVRDTPDDDQEVDLFSKNLRAAEAAEIKRKNSLLKLQKKMEEKRRKKEERAKEQVGRNVTYYVNQRLGSKDQDVFRGFFVEYDIEGAEIKKASAIKKIRLSMVEKESEIVAMKKTLQDGKECPNVLALNAIARSSEYIFMAVELCDGSLADNDFFKNFKLSPADKIDVCKQIGNGLNYLHTLGVYHRDIKPGNLLWRRSKNKELVIKVADMGISKVHNSEKTMQTVTTIAAGTPNYMPAEAFDEQENNENGTTGKSMTKESFIAHDMFSLGCVLNFVLTSGQHPFAYKNEKRASRIQMRIEDREPPDLTTIGKMKFELRENGAVNLVKKLISHVPEERGNATYVVDHPIFWSTGRRCRFICDSFKRDDFQSKFYVDKEPFGRKSDWRKMLDKRLWAGRIGNFIQPVGGGGKNNPSALYYNNTFFDCVRFQRNIHAHFNDYLNDVSHPLMSVLGMTGAMRSDCLRNTMLREKVLGDFFTSEIGGVENKIYEELYKIN